MAIARAVAKQPDVLFCDEPTGALDSTTGRAVLNVLKEVNEKLGATVVIVTHAASQAAMADRVIHFADGNVREEVVNKAKPSPNSAAVSTQPFFMMSSLCVSYPNRSISPRGPGVSYSSIPTLPLAA